MFNSLVPISNSTKTLLEVETTMTRKTQFAIGNLGVNERTFGFGQTLHSSDSKASRSLHEQYHTSIHLFSPASVAASNLIIFQEKNSYTWNCECKTNSVPKFSNSVITMKYQKMRISGVTIKRKKEKRNRL